MSEVFREKEGEFEGISDECFERLPTVQDYIDLEPDISKREWLEAKNAELCTYQWPLGVYLLELMWDMKTFHERLSKVEAA